MTSDEIKFDDGTKFGASTLTLAVDLNGRPSVVGTGPRGAAVFLDSFPTKDQAQRFAKWLKRLPRGPVLCRRHVYAAAAAIAAGRDPPPPEDAAQVRRVSRPHTPSLFPAE